MKKILPVLLSAVSIFLLFCSCTVQEEVSPDLFISRFTETYPDYSVETDGMFYENEKSVLFANDSSGNRFAIEMTTDEQGRVRKISLACVDADKAENMFSFAKHILSVYAPHEDAQSVAKSLNSGKSFSYYETQWYYYSFSSTEAGLFFSVENKKLSPEKDVGLTLKENDIVTTASE